MHSSYLYAVGVGSNRGHGAHALPADVVGAALRHIHASGCRIHAASAIEATAPMGPSRRTFANCVAIIECRLEPTELLAHLKDIERLFGRRGGQRWGQRTLDLDILLWSGGAVRSRLLTVPHSAFRARGFVVRPLAKIAPFWRDPVTGLTPRHLTARLSRAKPVDRARPRH